MESASARPTPPIRPSILVNNQSQTDAFSIESFGRIKFIMFFVHLRLFISVPEILEAFFLPCDLCRFSFRRSLESQSILSTSLSARRFASFSHYTSSQGRRLKVALEYTVVLHFAFFPGPLFPLEYKSTMVT